MDDMLEIITLGGLEVRRDGEPVTAFESDKVRALLAYLAVEADRPHRRESLAGLLWPDYPERSARVNLRGTLANLRTAIGDRDAQPPYLHISRQTIQFNSASDVWVDAVAFTDLVASKVPEREPLVRLEEAIELFSGSFLEGFSLPDSPAFEEWALLERERLHRLCVETLRQAADLHLERGEVDDALKHARRQLALDPLMEAAHRQVMVCLAYSGERSAAIAQYETCRQVLQAELAVEPGAETKALYQRMLSGEITVPAKVAPAAPRHNLPPQDTPFVGREAVLAEIRQLLDDPACRLLTLVGPGGSGKTRLALEVAERQLETHAYPQGVFFISLAPLDAVESIVPTAAEALDVTIYTAEMGGVDIEPQQQLLDYLRGKRMLLVMDNYEHLLEGARLVTEIHRTAPDVQVLATSRARLNVGGEHRYQVTGMLYPDSDAPVHERDDPSQYSAIKLFLQGAQRAKPGFQLTADKLSGVVRVCRVVEGMPLAIRLAAAWVEMLSPDEIAAEITQSLDFLETQLQDVPPRQRGMHAAFDHSWRLLTERERDIMERLSVFRGGFTRQAAKAVADALLPELRDLVNKSLLQSVPRSEAQTGQSVPRSEAQTGQSVPRSEAQTVPQGRYEIHELLRQYAREKIEAYPDGGVRARDRHSAYYTSELQMWEAGLKGARQQAALAEMSADWENIRIAWEWAAQQGHVASLDQAAEGLLLFCWARGRHHDGEALYNAAAEALSVDLSQSPGDGADAPTSGDGLALSTPLTRRDDAQNTAARLRVWAKVLACQGMFHRSFYRVLESREDRGQLARQALALLEDPRLAGVDTRAERALVLWELGALAQYSEGEKALRFFEDALVLYESLGDKWRIALMIAGKANAAEALGDIEEATRLAKESLELRQAIGDKWGTANALVLLGAYARYQLELEESERLLRESIALHQEIGHKGIESMAGVNQLCVTLFWSGKFSELATVAREALIQAEDRGLVQILPGQWRT